MCDCGCEALNGIPEEDEIPMWETPIYAAMMFEQVPQRVLLGLDPSAEARWRDSIPGRLWAVEGDPEMGVLFKKTNLTPYINQIQEAARPEAADGSCHIEEEP